LRTLKGSLKLVDVSGELPELKRKPGISKWKIQDKDLQWYTSHSSLGNEKRKEKIAASSFPPTDEEAKEFQLHKCVRVYPHMQDSGGFFIAVLEKVAPKKSEETKAEEEI